MRSKAGIGPNPPNTHRIPSRRDILMLLPALALTAYWVLSSLFSGAYFPSAWYPAAIVTVVLCPLLLAAGWRLPVGGTRLALALLATFVAWTALSILWAAAGGHALEATNKLLLALASAFVFAITPWTERRAAWLLGNFAVGVCAACVVTLISAALTTNPAPDFIEQRFAEPLGYAGASSAFAALAVWPALALAARRSSPDWLRAVMFAVAVVQIDLVFLPQSRGAAIGLVLSTVAFVALGSNRAWALLRLLIAAALAAVTVGPILGVYAAAGGGGSVTAALDDAVAALAIAAVVGLAAGYALAKLESWLPVFPGASTARRLRFPALGVLVLVVAVVATAFGGSLAHEASKRWDQFKAGEVSSESNSHLTSLGDPERYGYWRVAAQVTADHPLGGVGAGNYQDEYTIRRNNEKDSRYAHDIWLEVLSETGIVGFLLLVGGLATGVVAAGRARRTQPPGTQLLVAAAVATTVYVFAHASVDWVDEFPAILGPALAFLMLAGRLSLSAPSGPPHRAAGLLSATVIAGIALVALVPAYLATRYVERAEGEWSRDPGAAYTDLDRAAWLNPTSSQTEVSRGEIAIARGEYGRAREAFREAIGREDNWYPYFELATIAAAEGHRREALAQIASARRLNPTGYLVRNTMERLKRGAPVNPTTAREQIRSEANLRFYHLRQPRH